MADITLEIHHLDVRGGDATAIIVKENHGTYNPETKKTVWTETDIYRVLIDAGAEGSGSGALKHYLENYLKGTFDLVIATHYHQDHIQGFSQANIKFKKFLDNGSYKDADGTELTPKNDIGKGARTKIFDNYVTQTQTAMVPVPNSRRLDKPKRVPIPFIKKDAKDEDFDPVVIELGEGTGIRLRVYSANGILADGTDVLGKLWGEKKKAISPNDVSLAMVVEWGDFRYFTAGDLSGDANQTSYYDIEKPLVDYLVPPAPKVGPLTNKPITVFKASHHGSEFSNQLHLLTTLKPDTIIVCCNLQKQVPSPAFLQRLREYFEQRPDSRVVFTNTMKVFKQDDRYKALKKITDSIAGNNVDFDFDGDEEWATNLSIKTAVIRRRVQDGKIVRPVEPAPTCSMTYVDDLGYEIVLKERDADDATRVSQAVRFTSYVLDSTWQNVACGQDEIVRGFGEIADKMISWLATDAALREQEGFDYISEHYPALPRIINDTESTQLKAALVDKMTAMFTASFKLDKTLSPWSWKRTMAKDNKLTSDEKKTIFNLLWYNYHQPLWNKSIRRSGQNLYVQEKAWNGPLGEFPEPDMKGGAKRAAANAPAQRKTKQTRK